MKLVAASSLAFTLFCMACGMTDHTEQKLGDNFISKDETDVSRVIGNERVSFFVAGSQLRDEIIADTFWDSLIPKPLAVVDSDELSVGFPKSSLEAKFLFGGVITKAASRNDRSVGGLKLADVEPIVVQPKLEDDRIVFYGCDKNCEGDSFDKEILASSVIGIKKIENEEYYVLQLSEFTKSMKIVSKVSNFFSRGFLEVKETEIIGVDFSDDTFVFDVKTKLGPFMFKYRRPTNVTSRWFLRPYEPVVADNFKKREPVEAVGFFQTKRNKTELVTRFALPSENEGRRIKYYLKNVPHDMRPGMEKAFEDWNDLLVSMTGEELLEYEFVDKTDEKYKYVQTGDVRFNVLEWDTVNKASYGGLGPSVAYQGTGQIISGNVLIQGPQIEKMYKKWFGIEEKGAKKETTPRQDLPKDTKITLGDGLEFRIPSLMVEYADPIKSVDVDISPPPRGVTYEEYMYGMIRELTAHEVGHNLGLRHNFKGNLGATDNPEEDLGGSRTVMDYLGKQHRHIVKVGDYDRMAIAYAYAGEEPEHSDWFCTDQDVVSESKLDNSPECQRWDMTNDPFGYWMSEVKRLRTLALRTAFLGDKETSRKAADAMGRSLDGVMAYAATATKSFGFWTNFAAEGRPQGGDEVEGYLVKEIKDIVCNDLNYDVTTRIRDMVKSKARKWKLRDGLYHCKTLKVEFN